MLLPLAERLEQVRLKVGLTQSALAANVGISANHYQAIAHAQADPSVGVLLKLADALATPVAELFDPTPRRSDGWFVAAADFETLLAAYRSLSVAGDRMLRFGPPQDSSSGAAVTPAVPCRRAHDAISE